LNSVLSFQVERFGEPLVEVRRELPEPQGAQVVLEIAACGVCHSDVHLWEGFFDLGDGQKLDATRIVSPPRTLGHEIVGTVTAVGPDVLGVKAGARRVIYPWTGCGQCELCQAGKEHLCNRPTALGIQRDGGFAQSVLVPDEKYLLAYDPLPEAQACTYACAGLTAFGALKKALPLAGGEQLLIVGAGGVGLSAIRLAKALYGVAPVVAEVDREKWDVARSAGAGDVMDPGEPDALRTLIRGSGGGVAAAVDFVGAGSSFEFALGALRKAGCLISVGLFGGSARVAPALVAMRALSIIGSYVGSLDEMRELMQIARSEALPELPVTERPLHDVSATLVDLKHGRVRGRVVVRPNGKA
jgi:D-arabinose 1-dehydrogenase-like Zn-dependent alcohol dehydrogenase